MLEFTDHTIDVGRLARALNDGRAGALASFEGRVRNTHLGKGVMALEYEASAVLARNEFAKIAAAAKCEWRVLEVLCVHRVGRLEIGETAIWLGVLAPHRKEAFAACEHIMSELKARLPIWKKEFWNDGTYTWVDEACGCVLPKSE